MSTIEVIAICYNEEKMIPFFLDHYSKFADKITIYDNESTDSSRNLLLGFDKRPLEIREYSTSNTLDDSVYLQIKNHVWKNSSCDYVIIVDMDEFLYHPNIKKFIEETQADAYRPVGYNMVSEEFPVSGPLHETTTLGQYAENYSKIVLFRSNLSDINFSLGCHEAVPTRGQHQITPHTDPELKLLHYKNLSFDYRWNRHQLYKNRFSQYNKNTGCGYHYDFSNEKQLEDFNHLLNNSQKIV